MHTQLPHTPVCHIRSVTCPLFQKIPLDSVFLDTDGRVVPTADRGRQWIWGMKNEPHLKSAYHTERHSHYYFFFFQQLAHTNAMMKGQRWLL